MLRGKVAHFNILERLGGGALGDVYRARDTIVGRTVALMQPPASLVSDPRRRARFVEDAHAAAALNHPNIAALFDVIEEDEQCYLAYEFAAGPSLRQEMSGRRLGSRRAVEIAAQIADALAEGHARGIVHGDLRPDTVVVTPKGSVKVLNFGMVPWTAGGAARALAARSPESLTADEAVVAGYLSPEQAAGAAVDARSDLFTLGVMLYEMLTGSHPFDADTPASTIVRVIGGTAPPASRHHPDIPPQLELLLSRVLSKDPASRHQTAASLAADLRGVARAIDVRTGDKAPGSLIPLEEAGGTGKWWAVAAVAAAAAAWWLWR